MFKSAEPSSRLAPLASPRLHHSLVKIQKCTLMFLSEICSGAAGENSDRSGASRCVLCSFTRTALFYNHRYYIILLLLLLDHLNLNF